jgi:GGDEF domain-containing protein
MQTSGEAIQVHISIGFSLYPDTAECAENLRIQADRAMYDCKENRKQRAVSAL